MAFAAADLERKATPKSAYKGKNNPFLKCLCNSELRGCCDNLQQISLLQEKPSYRGWLGAYVQAWG